MVNKTIRAMPIKSIKKLGKDITNPIKEVIAQYLEVVLDDNLDDSPLKDIPALGSILKLYNAGIGIRDRIFYNKLVSFLENIDNSSEDARTEFWSKFETDEDAKRKLGEQLIIYIDRFDNIDKPVLLARAFNALQKGLISYNELLDLGILIISVKTHYLDKVAEMIYRLSDLDFKDLYERDEELPIIFSMEKDGLLMIDNEIRLRHVNGETERQSKVEKTYMATRLAINFIEHVIYDLYEEATARILEQNKTSRYMIPRGLKDKDLEPERQAFYARQAKASNS